MNETIARTNINARPYIITVVLLIGLSILAGTLISSLSFTGKIGISFFYREYHFLKVWWKDSLLVFVSWIIIWLLHLYARNRLKRTQYMVLSILSLIISLTGLYFSYYDFRHTLSHRWLGERFHLGIYIFWLVWTGLVIWVYRTPSRTVNT